MRRAAVAPREAPCFETLEPRVLYSTDPAGGIVTALLDDTPRLDAVVTQPASSLATGEGASVANVTETRRELVIVAANLPDGQGLAAALAGARDGDFELVRLAADRDALTQMGELLAQAGRPYDAVHLVTHAAPGRIDLGSAVGDRYLDATTLGARLAEIAGWGTGFTADGDFLLYGCELAGSAAGESLLADLGALLGVDVAASTDATGAAALGGNWTLEYALGELAPGAALAAANWSWTLDTVTANVFTDVVDGNTGSIAALVASPGADGGISLREAVLAANATGATDTITLLAGTYTLNSQLVVNQHLGITGAGAGASTIDGGGSTRLFDLSNHSLLLQKLTLQHGAGDSEGGALRIGSGANATLEQVVLRNNSALNGGAILSRGTLVATDVSFVQNEASSLGGGLYVLDGGATLKNATFSGNTAASGGGAIYANRSFSLVNSTVALNVASTGAGGIHLDSGGVANISNTLLAQNTGGNANKALNSLGFNLDTDDSAELSKGSDLVGPALLNDLSTAANGLLVHTLKSGSAAVDAGGGDFLAHDAAGLARNAIPDIGASENLAASRGKIYWADASGDAIVRANLDGSAQQGIVSGLITPRGLVVDDANRHVYWTDSATKKIQRAGLDGSNLVTIFDNSYGPYGLALDPVAGKLYFAEEGSNVDIWTRIDLDGTNLEELLYSPLNGLGASAGQARGVAVDPEAGKLYIADAGYKFINGWSIEPLENDFALGSSAGIDSVADLAVDTVNRHLYWVNASGDIGRAGLDGSSPEAVVSGLDSPLGVVVDPTGGFLYWTEQTQIGRANLDGSGVVRFSTSSFDLRELDLFTLSAVNAAPAGTDGAFTLLEDTPRTLAAADFGFEDADGHAFAGVLVATLPAAGSLRLDGVAVTAGQFVTAADIAANKLVFAPGANAHGTNHASFTFRVRDDGGTANGGADTDATANTLRFDVTAVNDAPSGMDATLEILEDTPRTLTAADFAFTDVEGHLFAGIALASLPDAGSLTRDGVAVTAGQFVTAADIAAGKLVYTPGLNANGANHASFTFRVRDDGGTADGGVHQDATPNTLRFGVTAVNDAPAGTDKTLTLSEDATRTLTAADFGFSDADGHAFAGVVVETLPGAGSLTLDGEEVQANQVVSATAIAANKLVFTPAANANGGSYASFTFRVRDDGGTTNGGVNEDQTANTVTFDVTPVNDAPAGRDNTIGILEDTPRTLSAADFGYTDIEGHAFAGVVISSLPAAGSLTLNGAPVTAGQFVTAADIAANKLVFTPAANANGNSHASFIFKVRDDGGTTDGGVNEDQSANTVTFDVTPVNDAPAGTDKTLTLPEDTTRTLTGGDFGFTDIENHAFIGVRVMTLPGAGSLMLNGVPVTAEQVISTTNIAAGKLRFKPDADQNGSNYASFTFLVRDGAGTTNGGVDWDQSANTITFNVTAVNDAPTLSLNTAATPAYVEGGAADVLAPGLTLADPDAFVTLASASVRIVAGFTAGDRLELSPPGGISASYDSATGVLTLSGENTLDIYQAALRGVTFRSGSDHPTAFGTTRALSWTVNDGAANSSPGFSAVNVVEVNDAPVITHSVGSRLYTEKAAPIVLDSGFSVDDADDGHLTEATVWIASGLQAGRDYLTATPGAGMSVVYDETTGVLKLTGAATVDAYEAALRSVTFHNTGDTPASTGQTRSVSWQVSDGESTSSIRAISVEVASVNDAPSGTDNSTPILEDMPYALTAADFGYTDIEGHGFAGVRVVGLPGAGSLTLNGAAVTANQVVSAVDVAANRLVFTPAANANGSNHASFTFRVRDDGGTASGGVDEAQGANTITFDVTPVNDAPSGTDNAITILEDTPYTLGTKDFGFSDIDGNAFAGVRIGKLAEAGRLSLDGQAVVTGQFVTAAQIAKGVLVFTPGENEQGAGYAGFTFRVLDDGGIANGGSALATTASTLVFHVKPVNDAPFGADWQMDMGSERLVLGPAQFAFSDVDGHTLAGVRIDSLPAEGRLLLDGRGISVGAVVSVADLAAGRLVFDAGSVASREVGFNFSVGDGLAFSAESRRATLAFAAPPAMMKAMREQAMMSPPQSMSAMTVPQVSMMQEASMSPAPAAAPPPAASAPRTAATPPTASAAAPAATPARPSGSVASGTDAAGDSSPAGFDLMAAAAFAMGAVPAVEMRAMDAQAAGSAVALTSALEPASLESLDRAAGAQLLGGLTQFGLDTRADIGALLAEIAEHARALDDGSGSQRALDAGSAAAAISAALETPDFIETLDALREDEQLTGVLERSVIGTGVVASTGMSVGYILYLLRGEFLLSGLLSSLPAWRMVDPLPVLSQLGDGAAGDDESLEQMVAGDGPAERLPASGDDALFAPVGDYA